jgi:hypothetical protein
MRPGKDNGCWPLRGQNDHPPYPPGHSQEVLLKERLFMALLS